MDSKVMTWLNNGSHTGLISNYQFETVKDHKGTVHSGKVRKWVKYPMKDGTGIIAWGRFGYLDLISSSKDFVVRVKNSKHKLLYLLYLSDTKAVSINKEKCTLHLAAMEDALMKLCVDFEGQPLVMIARSELNSWLDKKAPWNKDKTFMDKYFAFLIPSLTNGEYSKIHRDIVRLPRKQALLKVLGQSGKAATTVFKYTIRNRECTNYALYANGLKVEHLYELVSKTVNEQWELEHIYRIGCLLPQRYHHVIKVFSDTDRIALSLMDLLGKNKFKHINYSTMSDVHDYWAILNNTLSTKKYKLAQDPSLLKVEGHIVDGYTIVVPKYNTELVEWGNKLSICVGSYGHSINNGTRLVVGLYKNGEISLCVDIHNNNNDKAYSTQIKGSNNVNASDKVRFAVCEKLGIDGRFADVTYTSKKHTRYKFAKVKTVTESLTQEAVYELCEKAIYEFKKFRREYGAP